MRWLSAFTRRPQLSAGVASALAAYRAAGAPADTPLLRQRYVVLDVETTGLRPYDDTLLAIGAIVVQDGIVHLGETFERVLRQDAPSASENILVHGIGGTRQTSGTPAPEALADFLTFAGRSPLVAFHADFDRVFIERAMRAALGITPDNAWHDLARLAPAFLREHSPSAQTLDHWCGRFAIANYARHDAVADALATAQLFQVVLARAGRRGVARYHELAEHERAQRWLER